MKLDFFGLFVIQPCEVKVLIYHDSIQSFAQEKKWDLPMDCDDMSPCVARLFELHLADRALVVVVLHCQMRVGDHFRIILRLFIHLQ